MPANKQSEWLDRNLAATTYLRALCVCATSLPLDCIIVQTVRTVGVRFQSLM